jgi:hypothetical protein
MDQTRVAKSFDVPSINVPVVSKATELIPDDEEAL